MLLDRPAGDPSEDLNTILDELEAAVRQVNDAHERIRTLLSRHLAMAAAVGELEHALAPLRPPAPQPSRSPFTPETRAADPEADRPFARMLNPPAPPPDLELARERLGNIRWRLRDLGQRRRRNA